MHFETLVQLYIITKNNTGLIKYFSFNLKQIRFLAASSLSKGLRCKL